MRPAIDEQGHLWFGEMSKNYLGSFDPQTEKFWQQTPPDGQSGIMGIATAPDGTIWFAEQYADYIGHYFPKTGSYKVYPLPRTSTPDPAHAGKTLSLPSAPNDVVLDQHGILWFTEMNASAIGSLNTATGALRQYPLNKGTNASELDPYGITVDPQGQVWFTATGSGQLGQLDPLSGAIHYFSPPGSLSPLMEVASDAQGQIWVTNFDTGTLLQFHPEQQNFTAYTVPAINGSSGGIYGLSVAANGDIWLAVTSENLLARLEVKTHHFVYYTIPTPGSMPIGLVQGPHDQIWFTESGSNKIGVLQP